MTVNNSTVQYSHNVMNLSCVPGNAMGLVDGRITFPHKINGTNICGVNPFYPRRILEECCAGPITNITSPAPKDGPMSSSWPVTCMAYCPVILASKGEASDVHTIRSFQDCMGRAFRSAGIGGWKIICTGVSSPGPHECIRFKETPGCTDPYSPSTWGMTGYLPTGTMAQNTETQVNDEDSAAKRMHSGLGPVLVVVLLCILFVHYGAI